MGIKARTGFELVKPRRKQNENETRIINELTVRVWGIPSTGPTTAPYLDHYMSLLMNRSLNDGEDLHLRKAAGVIRAVEEVKAVATQMFAVSLREAEDRLETIPIAQISDEQMPPLSKKGVQNVLDFAIRLWLFTTINFDNLDMPLKGAIAQSLPDGGHKVRSVSINMLSEDFSAKSLVRKAGIRMVWTSNLPDHLTFATKTSLCVFRHATILRHYSTSTESELYPAGFLAETENTLRLLFPPESIKAARRIKNISRHDNVDLEVQIGKFTSLELENYPYWGERLAAVQRRYDSTKPKHFQQWYYDRRNRDSWATLWVAIIVFILTIVFGIISTITGVLQVIAAWQFQKSGS